MRLSLLDSLRGITIIEMLVFHILYDLNVVYGANTDWPFFSSVHYWQQQILLGFIFVSGMSFNLMSASKRLTNGIKLLVLGGVITLATTIYMPTESIYYGTLTFLGLALLLSYALEKKHFLTDFSVKAGLLACLLCFFITYKVQSGIIAVAGIEIGRWPNWLYEYNFALLGFPGDTFLSADYVPLLPHIFMYWLGYFAFRYLAKQNPQSLVLGDCRVLKCLGKHSLAIYLLHQPLFLALLSLFR